MKQIKSFTINHDYLTRGMYISRIDGDVITYDLRMKIPNNSEGDYLEDNAMHTFEHLFATYVRNTEHADAIIYAGPMGCRTGFYFLTRDAGCTGNPTGAGDTAICAGFHRRNSRCKAAGVRKLSGT